MPSESGMGRMGSGNKEQRIRSRFERLLYTILTHDLCIGLGGPVGGEKSRPPGQEVVMHRLIFEVALVLSAVVVAHAQEPKQTPKDVWNRIYTNAKDSKSSYNNFLAEVIKERKPGKALDIGIGDGRNSLFLAAQGWDVTGFDISDVGIKQARERAQSAGLKLNALVDDVDQFHYGQERWDLVVGMYEHEMITRNAEKIIGSLKHGGLIVVEGLHRDANQKGVEGDYYGYRSNELLRAFDRLRILRYEESKAVPYWTQNGRRLSDSSPSKNSLK